MAEPLDEFRKLFGQRKGFIAACAGEYFDKETKQFKGHFIKCYLESIGAFYGMPVVFDTIPVEYYICPDGLNPGCD